MKKLLCLLLTLMLPACALAQSVTLPQNVEEIAQEAFRGDTSIREVTIPDGTALIGAGAFEDCTSLQTADVPASVVTIGTNAFEGCAPALLIRTQAGSAAMTYAAQNLIDYQADTTYRALLIGQCQYPSPSELAGPKNDVAAMMQTLSSRTGTPYQCTIREDLTAQGISDAVQEVFANAKAQDVSLLYYSGHGSSGGKLVGVDYRAISPTSLRNLLDRIPGRKIVIVDACNSGAIIGRSLEATTADAFNEAFVSAFSLKKRSDLATDNYYVITACRGVEESVEFEISGSDLIFGLFTRHLCDGLGYDYLNQTAGRLLADTNGDGVVSIEEAWDYASTKAYQDYSQQSAQVYPDDCFYQGLVR